MTEFTMTIDGQAVTGPGTLKVINPATGTVFADLAEGARIVDEEQFGPALPILAYRTVPEAIERANATNYGLGASVWSADPLRAAEVAEQLEAGTVWVNTHMQLTHDAPFTGMKWSGLGSEMGLWSIYAYTDPQTVYRTWSQVIKKGRGRGPGGLVAAPGVRSAEASLAEPLVPS